MKKMWVIFLILFYFLGYSQNTESIDYKRIEIVFVKGNSWQEGIYSKSEVIAIIQDNNDFRISEYLKVNSIKKRDKYRTDTIKVKQNRVIKREQIDRLLKELDINKNNFTQEYLIENFTKPTKKEILKIAKEIDRGLHFRKKYNTKNDIETKYSELQEYKYLSEFIEISKPKLNEKLGINDAWNNLKIAIYSGNEMTTYDFQLFKNCGQPISINWKDKSDQIINLNVNLILKDILPKDSNILENIDLNNIRDEYIAWFIEHKMF